MPRVVPSQVVAVIDETIPAAKKQQKAQERGDAQESFGVSAAGQGHALAAILALLDRLPDELLVIEPRDYARYLAAVAVLEQVVANAQSEDRDLRRSAVEFSAQSGLLNPVTVVRQVLCGCPDEQPSPATAELAFIADADLREALRLDISSVNTALANGQFKAATVLAGSVIEALLLWKLQEPQYAARIDSSSIAPKLIANAKRFGSSVTVARETLEYTGLDDYLKLAKEIPIGLTGDTLIELGLVKSFRNFIHPGRVQRLGQRCDRGTALTAVGALEHVVRDLTP